MPFGRITPEQMAVIRTHVEGQTVHDVGAGDLGLAQELLVLGASRIVAIDRSLPAAPDPRITLFEDYFHNCHECPRVAFVSWPQNTYDLGTRKLLARSQVVIYLGKNTDGISCGGPSFFDSLLTREVKAYVPDPLNTLIVYGPRDVKRSPRGEEKAAIQQERIWSFEEVERG